MPVVGRRNIKSGWKIYHIKMKRGRHIQDGLWAGTPTQAKKARSSQTPHYYAFRKEDVASMRAITPDRARKLLKSGEAGWVD
jgi:hypothetical protein